MGHLAEIWVYLAGAPLTALTVTLGAWLAARQVSALCGWHPLANPVLIAVALLASGLLLSGVEYRSYFEGAQFVHFLLGPATVALAVPLYRQWRIVRRSLPAIAAAVVGGGLFSAAIAVAIAMAFQATPSVVASLAPKSVTAPVAMGIAEHLGGLPSLTAAVTICSGIIGASLGPLVLTWCRVRDWRARGLAMGTVSHGIGTAQALSVSATAGAFSGLAMGLNALATAILLPLLWRLVLG